MPLPNIPVTGGLGAIFPARRRSSGLGSGSVRQLRAISPGPHLPWVTGTVARAHGGEMSPLPRTHPARSQGNPPPDPGFYQRRRQGGRVARRWGSSEWGTKSTGPHSGPRGMLRQPSHITQHFERRSTSALPLTDARRHIYEVEEGGGEREEEEHGQQRAPGQQPPGAAGAAGPPHGRCAAALPLTCAEARREALHRSRSEPPPAPNAAA